VEQISSLFVNEKGSKNAAYSFNNFFLTITEKLLNTQQVQKRDAISVL
jgi:hypothetical protein